MTNKYSYIRDYDIDCNYNYYTQINPLNNTNTIQHIKHTNNQKYKNDFESLYHNTHNFIINTNNHYSYNVFKHAWKDNCTYDTNPYEDFNIIPQINSHYDYSEYDTDYQSETECSDSSIYSTDDDSDFEYV